jgi:ferritin
MPAILISKSVKSMLDEAVHSELFASNIYKHLANQMQRVGFFGAQKFFLNESKDELEHYQKIADFLNDRGAVADIPAIEAMSDKVITLRDAIETAYETEIQLEKDYARWYTECISEDVVTAQFLLQFLEIQRKSVGEYGDWLSRLDRAGNNEAAILMIDNELGEG